MKKIIAISLAVLTVIALFAGCSANARTAETENLPIVEINETVPDNTDEVLTEAESLTETEVPSGTTNPFTAILEATTSALAAESSTDSTTKKFETTSKKSETTTKTETTTRGETTTKKSSSSGSATTTKPSTTKPAETTTKPAPTTTSHTHNWTAHYAERKVLVQEGFYSETIITPQYHVHTTGYKCYTCGKEWGAICSVCGAFTLDPDVWPAGAGRSAREEYDKHCNETGHPVKSRPQASEYVEYGDPIVTYDGWVDPIYETEKYIDYYTCSCGAKKNA